MHFPWFSLVPFRSTLPWNWGVYARERQLCEWGGHTRRIRWHQKNTSPSLGRWIWLEKLKNLMPMTMWCESCELMMIMCSDNEKKSRQNLRGCHRWIWIWVWFLCPGGMNWREFSKWIIQNWHRWDGLAYVISYLYPVSQDFSSIVHILHTYPPSPPHRRSK